MKGARLSGFVLALVLGCFSAQASLITFVNLKERGGGAVDSTNGAITVTGFNTNTILGLVAGTYTRTLTVTNFSFATGMSGGTDSFKFDLVQSTVSNAVQFRNTSGVLLGAYQPLTITVTNFQVLTGPVGAGVSFLKMTSAVIYMLDSAGNTDVVNLYSGTSTNGTLLKSETRGGVSAHAVSITNTLQSLTVFRSAGLTTDYYNGLTFQVDVVPEPATVGMLGLGGLVVALVRRFHKR
jgi:hypothetical protein